MKIPKDSKIKFEDIELKIEDAKNEEMTVKESSAQNSIYFINNEAKDNSKILNDKDVEKKEEKKRYTN